MGIHQALIGGYPSPSGGGGNPTWTLVDSEFKQSVGASFSVDNVQTGDFLYWTQSGDEAGSIATLTGWSDTFSDTDNTPAFKEQYRVATSNEGTVTVTSESDTEAGGLMVFRCSTGATSIDANAYASSEGSSGTPVVPSANFNNTGTAEAYSLCIVNGYVDDDQTNIASCTGLTVAGVANGSRFFFFMTFRSSLMVGYAVIPNAGTTAPAGAGNTWSNGAISDEWNSTAWYIKPS